MIHKIAQFLIINSNTVNTGSVTRKIPLIFFLFEYADKYSKELYSEFSFDLLEDELTEQLYNIKKNKKNEIISLPILGFALIKFVEQKYFESDDLEDLLSIIDKVVFKEVGALSRMRLEVDYFLHLLIYSIYLKERALLVKKYCLDGFPEVKKFLLVAFYEILLTIEKLPVKQIELLAMFQVLISESSKENILDYQYLKALKLALIPKNKLDFIFTNFNSLKKRSRPEFIGVYNYLHSNLINKKYSNSIFNINSIHIESLMRRLYKHNNESDTYLRLIMCSILFLSKEKKINEHKLDFYLLGILLNRLNFKLNGLY